MATKRNQSRRGGAERERKFLIRQLPPGLARHPHELLEQGYLTTSKGRDDDGDDDAAAADAAEVRVRRAGKRNVLTVKKGQGPTRLEKEVPLPPDSARKLWPLTRGQRIAKVRYTIPHDELKIELDVYRGKLRAGDGGGGVPVGRGHAPLQAPCVVRQGGDRRHGAFNSELARHGWKKQRGR